MFKLQIPIGVFVIFTFFLIGCSSIVFRQFMPQSGTVCETIPKYIKGDFVSIYFDSVKLTTQFHTVNRISDDHILISGSSAEYLDSATSKSLGITKIDTVILEGKTLEVHANRAVHRFQLVDSIKASQPENQYEIDLSKHIYRTNFLDSSFHSCMLLQVGDAHFLNNQELSNLEQEDSNLWYVRKVTDHEDYIKIVSTDGVNSTAIQDSERLMHYYQFEAHQGKNHTRFIADVTDAKFMELMEEKGILDVNIWLKLKDDKPNKFWSFFSLAIVLISLITVIYFAPRMLKRINNTFAQPNV